MYNPLDLTLARRGAPFSATRALPACPFAAVARRRRSYQPRCFVETTTPHTLESEPRECGGKREASAVKFASGPVAPLPPTVNWHLEPRCNYGCKFCFATFNDLPADQVVRDKDLLLAVPHLLAAAGVSKLTFVGGEPFLHPHLEALAAEAKAAGLVTAAVTNGSLLTEERLRRMAGTLDWLAFSVDASTDSLHATLGRGTAPETGLAPDRHGAAARGLPPGRPSRPPAHLARVLGLWDAARRLGYRLKLNSVLTAANVGDEGLVELAGRLRPERWKVFQVLPIPGQTEDALLRPLLLSESQFAGWVAAAAPRAAALGVPLVAEDNGAMRGTYAMMDAAGRFYTDMSDEGHEYGSSVYDIWGRLLVGAGGREAQGQGQAEVGWGRRSGLGDGSGGDEAVEEQGAQEAGVLGGGCGSGGGSSAQQAEAARGAARMAALALRELQQRGAGGGGSGSGMGDGKERHAVVECEGEGEGEGEGSELRRELLGAGRAAVLEAWGEVAGRSFVSDKFASRGGVYDWGQGQVALREQREAWGASE